MLAGQTVETKWSFLLRDTARGIYYFIYNGFALIPKMGSSCAAHAYQGGNSKTVSHYSRITQITQTIQTQEVGIVKETMIASNSPIWPVQKSALGGMIADYRELNEGTPSTCSYGLQTRLLS